MGATYEPDSTSVGSKDSSRDLQANYVISFYFRLHLTFHACAVRFDVTENLENFLIFRVNYIRPKAYHSTYVLGILNANRKNPQAHGYRCSLHPGVFQSIDFSQGT